MNTSPSDFGQQIDAFLRLAGKQAITNPTPTAFVQWFTLTVPRALPALLTQLTVPPEEVGLFLRTAALSLYADLPMPGHDLHPVGKVKQGRNDPCDCGSGKKHKLCCSALDMPSLFGNLNLLRYVLDGYPQSRLGEVSTSKASIDAVADTAYQWLHADDLRRASALLEPYFLGAGPLRARLAPLFNLLMDSWLDLGEIEKRERLITSVLERGDRTMKSDAWQRRTTMLADQGDHAGAWRAFKQATEFNPNDPALSFLEVTTLTSEGRVNEAKLRAQWWATFLSKQRDPRLADLIERLRQMATDPHAGLLGVATEANPDLQRLRDLFLTAPAPAVRHRFEVFVDEDEDGVRHSSASEFVPDAALSKLEKRWRKVFPQVKPSLTVVHNDAEEVWDTAAQWLALLEKAPDLWFSFDVLDDLIMAVDTVGWAGVEERLLVPMAERVAEQLRLTLEKRSSGPVQCPWGVMDHRPVLRPIAHLAFICLETGNWQRFTELAQWLVFELNPNDNHGLRADLSSAYVRFERWTDVMALSQRYPSDVQPTLALNAVLATLALGENTKAQALARRAKKDYPVAVKMLQETALKPVKADGEFGITLGGKYEAWLYASELREFWERQNALAWLREVLKSPRGKAKLRTPTQPSLF